MSTLTTGLPAISLDPVIEFSVAPVQSVGSVNVLMFNVVVTLKGRDDCVRVMSILQTVNKYLTLQCWGFIQSLDQQILELIVMSIFRLYSVNLLDPILTRIQKQNKKQSGATAPL